MSGSKPLACIPMIIFKKKPEIFPMGVMLKRTVIGKGGYQAVLVTSKNIYNAFADYVYDLFQ